MPEPSSPLLADPSNPDGDDHLVAAERSMFGTRLPRPTGVGRHLIVVLVVFAIGLGIAIAFAERAQPATPAAPMQPAR